MLRALEAQPWQTAAELTQSTKIGYPRLRDELRNGSRAGRLQAISGWGPKGGRIYALAGTPAPSPQGVTHFLRDNPWSSAVEVSEGTSVPLAQVVRALADLETKGKVRREVDLYSLVTLGFWDLLGSP